MRTAEELYSYCLENGYGEGQNKKWGLKHFGLIEAELKPNENVLMAFIGLHNYQSATKHDGNYAYAVTNKRILMAQKKLVGQELQSIMPAQVNDITTRTGMLLGILTINTTSTAFNVAMSKPSTQKVAEKLHGLLTDLKSSSPATVPKSDSAADEIKKYKELLDLGAITQDEYDAKKKQLLGI